MVPELRRSFNAAFTAQRYEDYKRRLAATCACDIDFRVAESPVFLTSELRQQLVQASSEILELLQSPAHQAASQAAVPAAFDVPSCDERPTLAQLDFAVVRDENGRLAPRLIELQGFPSLYAFQLVQAQESVPMIPGGERLHYLLGDLDAEAYKRLLGDVLLGGHPPANVVLMDLDPPQQKTYPDFTLTERFWDIRAVCPTTMTKRGKELWYERDGKPTRILRIYNRLVVDELLAKDVQLPFDLRDELDVEWVPHPNWFFRWSKHSLPFLRHPLVPRAHFLSELAAWPDDLSRYVLKPLFSFAGAGVKVDVTRADLDAVPEAERHHALLMEKIAYEPAIETADGQRSKCEVRVMWALSGGRYVPVNTLIRLSQGKMMGVDFNKDRTWVGSAASLWEP